MEGEVLNENPSFVVWLIDITKYQSAICQTRVGDYIRFRINSEKNVEAYTIRSGGIGTISKKDAALFPLVYTKPIYFEGKVLSIANSSKSSYKVKVKIQVKQEYSFRLFQDDSEAMDKYITLESLVKKNQTIICNYGKAKVVEVGDDYILVDVPHLGQRKIYDFSSLEGYKE